MDFYTYFMQRNLKALILIALFYATSSLCQHSVMIIRHGASVAGKNVVMVSGVALDAFQARAAQAVKKIQEQRLAKITKLAESQWKSDFHQRYLRTKANMQPSEKPEFIVYFAHGYRPGFPGFAYAKSRYLHILAPFMKDFKYVAFHPSLSVGPAVTTFAQEHDIFQVKFHLDKIIELARSSNSPYFGLPIICVGHSNGAATLLATFGAYPELAKSVSSLALFAPYADVRQASLLGNMQHKGIRHHVKNALPHLSGMGYDVQKPAPIDYIRNNKFPKDLPVFLIHCKDDPHVKFIPNYTSLESAFKEFGYASQFHGYPLSVGGHSDFSLRPVKVERLKFRDGLGKFIRSEILHQDASHGDFSSLFYKKSMVDELIAEPDDDALSSEKKLSEASV